MFNLPPRWRRLLQRARRAWENLRPHATPPVGSEWRDGHYQEPVTRGRWGRRVRGSLHYRLFVPSHLLPKRRAPLLVMLHGCSQDADAFATGTRMNALAEAQGCMVLYPQQNAAANPLRCWNWFNGEVQKGQGEAALIARLVQEIVRREGADARRVYVAGMSAGAGMAEILALRFPKLFAASALHSGLMWAAASSGSEAMRAMRIGSSASPPRTAAQLLQESAGSAAAGPMLVIHGSADDSVHPRNMEQIVAQRLALAGAGDTDAVPPIPSDSRDFESGDRTVHQRDFAQAGRLLVRTLTIDGLGHAWSGGDATQPFNDAAGPDASRLLLEFVLQYRLPAGIQRLRTETTVAL